MGTQPPVLSKYWQVVDLLLELGPLQKACLAITIFTAVILIHGWFSAVQYPNIPRVCDGMKGRFSLRTRLAYFTDCQGLFREAYENYLKKGQPCLIPGIGLRTELLLPNNALRWLTAQPENILSLPEAIRELDHIDWAGDHHKYVTDSWLTPVLKREVNRNLDKYMGLIGEEIKDAVGRRFPLNLINDENGDGDGDGLREVRLYSLLKLVIAQSSSHFSVGEPLCKDEEYLRTADRFVNAMVATAGIVPFIPVPLRPIICPLIYLPVRYFIIGKLQRMLGPLLKSRVERLLSEQHSEEEDENQETHRNSSSNGISSISRAADEKNHHQDDNEPQDQLQLMLRYALSERPNEDLHNYPSLAYRLTLNNLGTFHQTAIAATNAIFNILASDKEFNTVALLREEIASMLPKECYTIPPSSNSSTAETLLVDRGEKDEHKKIPDGWTKAALAKLTRTDSVLRETMRTHSFVHRSILRKVVADNVMFSYQVPVDSEPGSSGCETGTTTTSSIPLPKGSMISILYQPLYRDAEVFDDPNKFNPWRFAISKGKQGDDDSPPPLSSSSPSQSFTTTSAQNMHFGHGRHACPGRFLAEAELKMLVAYLLMNYEMELVPGTGGGGGGNGMGMHARPESRWIMEVTMPPVGREGTIRMRRRV
ncbi:hypothetical protein AJ79_02650 [Helicocarpus griseus UAMH5409]|uniref:Cytochrome P450 n=1 Tax=Helicocarpus griseus UAMH5409 TaxID=1447875 RepID=A0A2B7XTN4_9EURO|nr:hypothetical protein AJ79_02650 [Helicocarpus griseus UAMH5409]